MNIRLAADDLAIKACYGVMQTLRPHLAPDEFLARVKRQQQSGYRLAMLEEGGEVLAVAGFRLGENLAWGRFLYVDDLVTRPDARSRGFGSALLAWLRQEAVAEGCAQLHLDSGMQRKDAHRFYLREGLEATSLHFAERLGG